MLISAFVLVLISFCKGHQEDEEVYRLALQNPDLFGGDMMGMDNPEERNAIPWDMFRWPEAKVPYVIDTSLKAKTDVITDAMNYYHTTTCVRFVPRKKEDDYIRIFSGQGEIIGNEKVK